MQERFRVRLPVAELVRFQGTGLSLSGRGVVQTIPCGGPAESRFVFISIGEGRVDPANRSSTCPYRLGGVGDHLSLCLWRVLTPARIGACPSTPPRRPTPASLE
jgi:hypothetical protein